MLLTMMVYLQELHIYRLHLWFKVLLVVIIGGRGEIYGAIVGAYFVAILEKVLTIIGAVNYILFPLILLIMLFSLKEGLYGLYWKHKYRDYYPTIKVRKTLTFECC